jgi:hypothetical protein
MNTIYTPLEVKAIKIAIGTFLSDYDENEVDTYTRLKHEELTDWGDIDYAYPWLPFEMDDIAYLMGSINTLIDSIIHQFKEV